MQTTKLVMHNCLLCGAWCPKGYQPCGFCDQTHSPRNPAIEIARMRKAGAMRSRNQRRAKQKLFREIAESAS